LVLENFFFYIYKKKLYRSTSFTREEIIEYYNKTGLFTYNDLKIFIEFLDGGIDKNKDIVRNVLVESYKKISQLFSETSSTDRFYKTVEKLKDKAEELREKVKVEFDIQY